MIDRDLLKDMGFELGSGWDHEVWVYDGDFWVHFGGEFGGIEGRQISSTATRKEFFEMFIDAIRDVVMESATVRFR